MQEHWTQGHEIGIINHNNDDIESNHTDDYIENNHNDDDIENNHDKDDIENNHDNDDIDNNHDNNHDNDDIDSHDNDDIDYNHDNDDIDNQNDDDIEEILYGDNIENIQSSDDFDNVQDYDDIEKVLHHDDFENIDKPEGNSGLHFNIEYNELSIKNDALTKDEGVTISRIKSIKVPPAVKGRGRPKGQRDTNVIGLKRSNKKNPCVRFCDLKFNEKLNKTLSLCIGNDAAMKVLSTGSRVQLEHVFPTEIDPAVFNPIISIQSIKFLFESDAWDRFYSYYTEREHFMKDRCFTCSNLCPDEFIRCDKCLRVFDFKCGRVKPSKRKRSNWFCPACKLETKATNTSTKENEEPNPNYINL